MTNSRSHANNRHAMALRLAEALWQVPQADSDTVALLSDARRRQVEALAGEAHHAGDETWTMVVDFLRSWEARRVEAAIRWIDDERALAVA